MRNKCSALNVDLYHANLIVNYNCLCEYFNENAEHYFTGTWVQDICFLQSYQKNVHLQRI